MDSARRYDNVGIIVQALAIADGILYHGEEWRGPRPFTSVGIRFAHNLSIPTLSDWTADEVVQKNWEAAK
jgi:hypothetical protein